MKNLKFGFIALAFLISAFSCVPKLKMHKIMFDEKAGFYVYERRSNLMALRMQNGQLVARDSMKSFLTEVANNGLRYNTELISENNILFVPEEKSLLNMYNILQASLESRNSLYGITLANEIDNLYPQAFKYTDIDYIRGKFWEQLNYRDSALFYYQRFLLFSEKKYSGFFRGYENDARGRECFFSERSEAHQYIQGTAVIPVSVNCTAELTPKYYFQSFSQGFVLNRDDFGALKKNNFGIGLQYDNDRKLSVGVGNTWLANEKYVYRTSIEYSKNQFEITLSGSYQLYKLKDNSMGLKISPYLVFTQFGDDDSLLSNKQCINPALSFSFGYRFNQRWYMGASYAAFLFNQYTHSSFKKAYYKDNSYDISLYYQLMKGISFKAGIESGYPVIGFGLIGGNLGYFFKNKGFGVRMHYY